VPNIALLLLDTSSSTNRGRQFWYRPALIRTRFLVHDADILCCYS